MLHQVFRSTIAGVLATALFVAPMMVPTPASASGFDIAKSLGKSKGGEKAKGDKDKGGDKDKDKPGKGKFKGKGKGKADAPGQAKKQAKAKEKADFGRGSDNRDSSAKALEKAKKMQAEKAPATPRVIPTVFAPNGEILVLGISADVTRNAPISSPRPPRRPS